MSRYLRIAACLMLGTLIGSSFLPCRADNAKAKKFLEAIQGRWKVTGGYILDKSGNLVEEKIGNDKVMIVNFIGNLGIVYLTEQGRTEVAPYAYLVDIGSDPIGCDWVSYSGRGKTGPVIAPGIIRLQNGKLQFARNLGGAKERPKTFDPRHDKNCHGLIILERLEEAEKKK